MFFPPQSLLFYPILHILEYSIIALSPEVNFLKVEV